jgi:hypothetical protein
MRFLEPSLSAMRFAWYLIALSAATACLQPFTPCQASGAVAGCGMGLALLASLCCLLIPRGTLYRFAPAFIGLTLLFVHACTVH